MYFVVHRRRGPFLRANSWKCWENAPSRVAPCQFVLITSSIFSWVLRPLCTTICSVDIVSSGGILLSAGLNKSPLVERPKVRVVVPPLRAGKDWPHSARGIMNTARTLKQRLAALTANGFDTEPTSSTPINRSYVPRANIPRRRPFNPIPPPVPPRRGVPNNGELSQREEKVQEVMTRVIFQAGVDYECVICSLLSAHVIIRAGALQDKTNVRCSIVINGPMTMETHGLFHAGL